MCISLAKMLRSAESDKANTVTPNDVDVFIDNAMKAICYNHHTVCKAPTGTAIFGCNIICSWTYPQRWEKVRLISLSLGFFFLP
jgi:hypothetical protein